MSKENEKNEKTEKVDIDKVISAEMKRQEAEEKERKKIAFAKGLFSKKKQAEMDEKMGEKVSIRINGGAGGDMSDVEVGVNGVMFQIQRNHWVEVPRYVVEVLDNSVIETIMQVENREEPGKMKTAPVSICLYPYSVRDAA